MQRWRLNRTTYWSTEAAGPRLQLGVAGIGGREDGIAESQVTPVGLRACSLLIRRVVIG
jgi:hypothetical protein